jgi:hypothetical protein
VTVIEMAWIHTISSSSAVIGEKLNNVHVKDGLM